MSLVTDRLSAGDTAFLYAQDAATPMHVGGVVVLEPAPGLDYDRIVAHIAERLPQVPRYRQKVRAVPGRLARPVWVDDEDFDLTYHLRRSALPRPGSDSQLDDLVGRLISRPLDRSRPLWEMYVVEGLAGGRIAIVNKTHEAMVDRLGAVDLAAAILEVSAEPDREPADNWIPQPAPSGVDLVVDAVSDLAARPTELLELVRQAAVDVRSTVGTVSDLVGGIVGILAQTISPAPRSALGAASAGQRRYSRFAVELDTFRRIRSAYEGTVNDVVLTVLTGALRSWLLARGEPVTGSTSLRALVPMSVRAAGDGAPVTSLLIELPVAESNPSMRLHQIAIATRAHRESGRPVSADALMALGRYSPPTLHALGARVGSQLSRRAYDVLVTNVPGPQIPLFVGGATVHAMYPIAPLVKGHALAVACTSYRGRVYFGLTADRDAMPDIDGFAVLLGEAVTELAESAPRPPQEADQRHRDAGRRDKRRPNPARPDDRQRDDRQRGDRQPGDRQREEQR